ncbi:hypothetical protein Taro_055317 [Colocasia esculenta]|uniref:Uncharacterized protein n=1 Tax=Colocasia esculenta TaxID=4460 RepID=A0A843XTW2_COLES|nr:hypothetical protein [Colocasia esculenta]
MRSKALPAKRTDDDDSAPSTSSSSDDGAKCQSTQRKASGAQRKKNEFKNALKGICSLENYVKERDQLGFRDCHRAILRTTPFAPFAMSKLLRFYKQWTWKSEANESQTALVEAFLAQEGYVDHKHTVLTFTNNCSLKWSHIWDILWGNMTDDEEPILKAYLGYEGYTNADEFQLIFDELCPQQPSSSMNCAMYIFMKLEPNRAALGSIDFTFMVCMCSGVIAEIGLQKN